MESKINCGFKLRLFLLLVLLTVVSAKKYEPNWESIDSRPLPSWYDESKIGIFIHWGVFSVPSLDSEWFWYYWKHNKLPDAVDYMKNNYKPDFTYADFAPEFTAELYNPDHWADVFKASGAKYVVLTSKHHEGFTNWPSKYSFNWNAMDVGPRKDLVGMLANSIRSRTDMHFGLYHSLFEWFNPVFLNDQANGYSTRAFVEGKSMPELYEIVNAYKPDIIWSDGTPKDALSSYWNSTGFLAWLYNESPVKDSVVTNDRWGNETSCKHGGFYSCNDRFNPGTLQPHKWENAMTLDKSSWGFRRNMDISGILTMEELLATLIETVSCGGNILINVGPTKDGIIVPIFEERLRSLGEWLNVNGEAIYKTRPWTFQNDTTTPHVWYTAKKSETGGLAVYAHVLKWPIPGPFYLDSPITTQETKVTLLGYQEPIDWWATPGKHGVEINIPAIPFNQMPCKAAWVFKMENLE